MGIEGKERGKDRGWKGKAEGKGRDLG